MAKFNGLQFPSSFLTSTAREAALDAASAFSNARIELAMPRQIRQKSDRQIHADVLAKLHLANRLSEVI